MNFQVFTPQGNIHRLYLSIIEDISENVRDSFLDEGLDESHLNEFAHVWQVKLDSTKALEVGGNSSGHDRHIQSISSSKMITPIHANRFEDSRLNYQHKLPHNMGLISNYNSKNEPIDFSTAAIHMNRNKQMDSNTALALQNLQHQFKYNANARCTNNNQSNSNAIRSQQYHNILLNRSNCAPNMLSIRQSSDIPRNQIQHDSQIKVVSSLIKDEPKFILHAGGGNKLTTYESIDARNDAQPAQFIMNMNDNDQRRTSQYMAMNNMQQDAQTPQSINLNAFLQQHPSLAQNQPIYIKQLVAQHQANKNIPRNPDPDNNQHNSSLPQFDGQTGDDDLIDTRNLVPNSEESSDDDDEMERFDAIAPEFSDVNDIPLSKEDSEPLNSDDDVSEEDSSDLFETDNIIVCQFDKINRSKARWKFMLKEGMINIRGKDYVFSKAQGEADW